MIHRRDRIAVAAELRAEEGRASPMLAGRMGEDDHRTALRDRPWLPDVDRKGTPPCVIAKLERAMLDGERARGERVVGQKTYRGFACTCCSAVLRSGPGCTRK